MKISVNCHSSIQVDDLFFDPFKVDDVPCEVFDTKLGKISSEKRVVGKISKAKILFLTHTHFDHLSESDLLQVASSSTIFVAPLDAQQKLEQLFPKNKKYFVLPDQKLTICGVTIETFPAYNLNKDFHKKEYNWLGYRVCTNGESFAVLGDCDALPLHEKLSVDVLFVPIGGTYTMTAMEASNLVNKIMPKIVVPVHYNSLVGSKQDKDAFAKNLDSKILLCDLIK